MIFKTTIFVALFAALAACEKEQGVGFTGIGAAASQSSHDGYTLDFPGLGDAPVTAAVAR